MGTEVDREDSEAGGTQSVTCLLSTDFSGVEVMAELISCECSEECVVSLVFEDPMNGEHISFPDLLQLCNCCVT